MWPEILPDDRRVLFTVQAVPLSESRIAVISLETGEQKTILEGGTSAGYLPTGHLVYAFAGNLWAVGFDLRRLEVMTGPTAVVEGVVTKVNGGANYSVADDGSLIFMPGAFQDDDARLLAWVDRDGSEELLNLPSGPYFHARVSPDGRRVALTLQEVTNSDVMVFDVERETLTRLTRDPAEDDYPVWSLDGERILFASDRDGVTSVYARAADGTGPVERVTDGETPRIPQSWSADGETLVVTEVDEHMRIAIVSPGSENQSHELSDSDGFNEMQPAVSPDGRWIAYVSDESDRREVYVRPFPRVSDGRWQISRDGGLAPVWSRDGSELIFRSIPSQTLMTVSVTDGSPFTTTGSDAQALLTVKGCRRCLTSDVIRCHHTRLEPPRKAGHRSCMGCGGQVRIVIRDGPVLRLEPSPTGRPW